MRVCSQQQARLERIKDSTQVLIRNFVPLECVSVLWMHRCEFTCEAASTESLGFLMEKSRHVLLRFFYNVPIGRFTMLFAICHNCVVDAWCLADGGLSVLGRDLGRAASGCAVVMYAPAPIVLPSTRIFSAVDHVSLGFVSPCPGSQLSWTCTFANVHVRRPGATNAFVAPGRLESWAHSTYRDGMHQAAKL